MAPEIAMYLLAPEVVSVISAGVPAPSSTATKVPSRVVDAWNLTVVLSKVEGRNKPTSEQPARSTASLTVVLLAIVMVAVLS